MPQQEDDYQIINVPTVGPIRVPSSMPDDQIHDNIVKNFPQVFAKQRAASDAAFSSLVPKMPNTPDLTAQRLANLPDAPQHEMSKWQQAKQELGQFNGTLPQLPDLTHGKAAAWWQKNMQQPYLGPAVDEGVSALKWLTKNTGPGILPTSAPTLTSQMGTKDIPEALAPHKGTPGTLEPGDSKIQAAARGAGEFGWNLAGGLTTPEMMGAALGFKVAPGSLPAKLAGAGWSAEMLKQGGPQAVKGVKELSNSNIHEGTRDLLGGVSSVALGAAGAHYLGSETAQVPHTEPELFPDLGRRQAEQQSFNFNDHKQMPDGKQLSFGFDWTLPKQQASNAHPEMDANGQYRLLPKQPQQLELKPEERAPQTTEGPSAQTAFRFPEGHWQRPLPFDDNSVQSKITPTVPAAKPEDQPVVPAKAAEATPEITTPTRLQNPSSQSETLEPNLRKLSAAMIRTRQLSQAASRRLQVELALKASGGKDTEDTLGSEYSQLPIVRDNKSPVTSLPKDDLSKVQAVSEALGVAPNQLADQNYYLTHGQINALTKMKAQGLRPMQLPEDHPEAAFQPQAPYPLAKINTANAKAAGIPDAKNLWAQLPPAMRKAHDEFVSSYTRGDSSQANEADTVGSRGRMGSKGAVTADEGKDEATLQHEHDMLQSVLVNRFKQFKDELNKRVPAWRNARINEAAPSKLAQDLKALDPASRVGIPKELYADQHLNPKAATGSVVSEPIQTPPPSQVRATGEGSKTNATIEGIHSMADEIQRMHGQAAFEGMSQIFDAVAEKYKQPENVNKVLYSAIQRYQEHLARGTEDPIKAALNETVNSFPAEKPGATLYANPIGPIFNKIFGRRQTPVIAAKMPGPLTLVDSPIHMLTDELEQRAGASNQERFGAFMEGEKSKLQDAIMMAPSNAKLAMDKVKEWVTGAWNAYKTRPGLNPLESAFGYRRLQLEGNAQLMHSFHDEILRNHPSAQRREAMVNYLQASGGVMSDRDVNAQLQLKADMFAPSSYENAKLKKGYLNAQNLTPEEKATVQKYREYDTFLSKQEEAAGVQLHALENYIRQVWSPNSLKAKGIEGIFSSSSYSVNPNFMKMRKYLDYFEGEQEGLLAKRKDFGYLVESRARASAEVLANRTLVQHLYNQRMPDGTKLAVPDGTGNSVTHNPTDPDKLGAILVRKAIPSSAVLDDGRAYVRIDHPAFQNWKWVGKADGGLGSDGKPLPDTDVLYKGDMLVHPDIYKQLNRILEPSRLRQNAIGNAALKLSSIGKQTLLIGLFHPVQLGVHFLEHAAEGSTSSRTMKALNPFADPTIDLNDITQQYLVLHGLKLSDFNTDSLWDEGVMSRGFANSVPLLGKPLANLHDAMFQKYIPNLKMAMALDAYNRNLNRYHDSYKTEELAKPNSNATNASIKAQSRIYRMTAEQMNAAFGGLNWESIPVNKTVQDFLRLTVLAPDFLLARMQFAGDAFRPGGMESRKALLIGAALQYVTARAFNGLANDGDMKLAPQDWNKFISGKKEYNLRTVQGDMTDSVFNTRQFISHRLNPGIPRVAAEAIEQKDVFGHPASAGQQLYDAAKNFMPIPVQGFADTIANKIDPNLRGAGQTDPENKWAPLISSLTGVQTRQYRSPAEKIINDHFYSTHQDQTDDDLSLEQKRTFNSMRDKVRNGTIKPEDITKALNDPKANLKDSEVEYLYRTQNETQLVSRARQLPFMQVWEAFDNRNVLPMEKAQLAPLLQQKMHTLAPQVQQEYQKKLADYRRNLSPQDDDKIQNQIQNEVNWEQRKKDEISAGNR